MNKKYSSMMRSSTSTKIAISIIVVFALLFGVFLFYKYHMGLVNVKNVALGINHSEISKVTNYTYTYFLTDFIGEKLWNERPILFPIIGSSPEKATVKLFFDQDTEQLLNPYSRNTIEYMTTLEIAQKIMSGEVFDPIHIKQGPHDVGRYYEW